MANFVLKEIKTLKYEIPEIDKGYTNHTLKVDISIGDIQIKPVSNKMKKFLSNSSERMPNFSKIPVWRPRD